jgi:preprotein translocase subunit SecD
VFFERFKDEVHGGKSPRAAVQPAFKRSFRTIVAADIVTALAAVVLYLTAISSVRGFALTLGVSVLLDLFVVYFFKRPAVYLIARNEKLVTMPVIGLTSGVAVDTHAAPAIAGGAK